LKSLDILPSSLLKGQLESLADLYLRADTAVAHFARASGVSCPDGCGLCCEGFVPDILPLEAAYVAVWLAGTEHERAVALTSGTLSPRIGKDGKSGCPLYDPDTPYHCTVYESRPLICRMFGFAGTRDKLGAPTFSVCRHGVSDRGARTASGAALVDVFGMEPPVMAGYGSGLVSIDPDSAGNRKPLPEILPAAIGRVLFLIGMTERSL